jgi:hypothetical protein
VPASTNHDQEADTVLAEHYKGVRLVAVSAHDAGTHAAADVAMTGSVFEASPAATAVKSVQNLGSVPAETYSLEPEDLASIHAIEPQVEISESEETLHQGRLAWTRGATLLLIVHSHQELEVTISIDAILHNSDSAQRAFLGLKLRFVDITGVIVAHRLFVPAEYLHVEMRGLQFVSGQTAISLAFEIIDPELAVGYSVGVIRE